MKRCLVCRKPFKALPRVAAQRLYCSRTCKMRAYFRRRELKEGK
jgi:hypothetical protein